MTKEDMTISKLFDLSHTLAAGLLERYTYPWEVLPKISEYIKFTGWSLDDSQYNHIGDDIWIHKSVELPPSICMRGPLIIEEGAKIRHCAFIRGNVIIGKGSVLGNSCEIKNSIMFDNVQAPHYNYIGDSILGYGSHMGAQSLTSNVKSDKKDVVVHGDDGDIKTSIYKFGAMIGDNTEIGCGSVLNPGTIIGKNCIIYPLSSVRGTINDNSIYKSSSDIVTREVR